MKGYYTTKGYMGYVIGEGYRLFESEDAYYAWKFETYPDRYTYTPEELFAPVEDKKIAP